MARLILQGDMADVELTRDPEEGDVVATCVRHSEFDGRLAPAGNCAWTDRYDDMADATEYAADHADRG
jgi:hypothetical protein